MISRLDRKIRVSVRDMEHKRSGREGEVEDVAKATRPNVNVNCDLIELKRGDTIRGYLITRLLKMMIAIL